MLLSPNNAFKFEEAQRIKPFGRTVWQEFSGLSAKFKTINLGQGFPNWSPPEWVLDIAKNTFQYSPEKALTHQYAVSTGHLRLSKILAQKYSRLLSVDLNDQMILTTVGSSEGICAAMQGLVDPGDEVIVFEPTFDIYIGAIAMAGGTPRFITLKASKSQPTLASDFVVDLDQLEKAMNEKTKVIILNTPHNPTGKVFSKSELEDIARIVSKHPRCLVILDEVYEHLTYDGLQHFRFATLPGMFERSITISSSGKLFSSTGWKIGWVIGTPEVISAIARCHQFIPFSVCTPLQEVIAVALEQAEEKGHYQDFLSMYTKKRDFLFKALKECGLNPILPQGSFFILADVSKLKLPVDKFETLTNEYLDRFDWNVCRWLTTEIGVTAIPVSAFFGDEHGSQPENQQFIRFAFCKTDEALKGAQERLISKLKPILQNVKN